MISYPCLGNWAAIARAVVFYARAARAFNAGIKCMGAAPVINTLATKKSDYSLLHHVYVFFAGI